MVSIIRYASHVIANFDIGENLLPVLYQDKIILRETVMCIDMKKSMHDCIHTRFHSSHISCNLDCIGNTLG